MTSHTQNLFLATMVSIVLSTKLDAGLQVRHPFLIKEVGFDPPWPIYPTSDTNEFNWIDRIYCSCVAIQLCTYSSPAIGQTCASLINIYFLYWYPIAKPNNGG